MSVLSRRQLLRGMGAAGALAAYGKGLGRAAAAAGAGAGAATQSPGPGVPDGTGFESAVELARRIREKEVGSLELTRYFIERIERYDETLNAVVVRDFDRALEAAKEADAALARGESGGPLHGLPMTIKESYDIEGLATTWGNPAFESNVSPTDSEVVKRFEAAGAHFMGKTNVPFMLSDFQSYNEIYGTTNNPWDPTRIPGGSSGGSAAALAAGLTGLDSGSDIGGSIRNPAHYCGVYGHKPTWGVVPPQGHDLPPQRGVPDLAVVGPLARSAEDLALALDVVAGADPLNAPGWRLELPPPRARSLRELRVAVWPTDEQAPVDREISDRVQQVADILAQRGATVSDRARPSFDPRTSFLVYANLLFPIMGAGVPDAVHEARKKQAAELDPQDMSMDAITLRAQVLDHRSWLRYNSMRTQLREQWKSFFEEWDIVLCPIVATTAFPHDHRPMEERALVVNGKEQPYFQQIFWAGLATVAYLPATIFPTGPSEAGLPIGLQAIGAEFADRTTIEIARLLAEELGGFVPPPGFQD